MELKILAILFASGEPVEIKRIFEILDSEFYVELEFIAMNNILKDTPFLVIKIGESFQLVTKPEFSELVHKAVEEHKTARLSNAALEVLIIIAYNEPITRVKIDDIRKIDSSYTVSSLLAKGFIEVCGKLDVLGKPNLYRTTERFLRTFNIESLEDLPNIHSDLGGEI